jgi:hypothetical protein
MALFFGEREMNTEKFPRGRPVMDPRGRKSPNKIDWNRLKLGKDVHVKMDTTDKKNVVRRRHSYSASAINYGMTVSCSILQKPGFMTIRRVK